MTYPRADDKQDYYRLEELFTKIEPHSLLRTLAELSAEKIRTSMNIVESLRKLYFMEVEQKINF